MFTVSLPWRGTYVIEIEHVDAKAGGEGAGAYDRKRFVTSLSFRVSGASKARRRRRSRCRSAR